ncbi:MAG TPA: LytR C-terminal domain-containing protein, partial [Solirubrobacteraceae bacterium]|nr:LytR C-terminal domain-containing protein [Solirubrobacteraceae bacterium]
AAAAAASASGATAAPPASSGPAPAPGAVAPTQIPTSPQTPGVGAPDNAAAPSTGPTVAATAAAAAAQRSASLSSYGNGSTGQDTRESAAARPEPLLSDADDDGGLSTGRIAMYVGGAVATVLVAVVLLLVLTGGDDTQPPNDFGNTPAQEPQAGTGAAGSAGGSGTPGAGASALTATERRATKVAVLNGTTQTGLARNVGDKIEKERFTIASIGTNADQQIPATIVAYRTGHEPAARAVAKIVGVSSASVQPADANASASADADVVVTVGLDQTG